MSYSESVNQKYFEVEAKCGHVGKTNCIWIRFAVVAESRKDAAKRARMFRRVKHDHPNAIGYVKEIDFESFMVLKAENDADPYLHCKSKREQNQIEGFSERIEPDEFNIAKRQKKNTRNAEYKLRKSRCAEYDAKRKIIEHRDFLSRMRYSLQRLSESVVLGYIERKTLRNRRTRKTFKRKSHKQKDYSFRRRTVNAERRGIRDCEKIARF